MEKKVALVTGCTTGGIGFAYCKNLLARGYTVYATSRSAETIVGLNHPRAKVMSLDVTHDQQVIDNVVKTIINTDGQIDLLINNAGVLAPGPCIDFDEDQMKEIYDINVFSILKLCRAVIPHMARRKKGTIINMGSVVGSFPTPWMGVYDSSKAALHALTEVLSLETRPFNLSVVLVTPASIKSNMLAKFDNYELSPDSMYKKYAHNVRERLDSACEPGATPPEVFVETILGKVLKPHPPIHILTGFKSNMFRMLGLLPRKVYLNIVWDMFSKAKHD